MRIATWNVNSLGARLERVEDWLSRAEPDVLLLQETKLADNDVPVLPFEIAGYEVAHHGEGRWNGVAIVSRIGIDDVVTNFGDGPIPEQKTADSAEDFNPFDDARMIAARCDEHTVVSLYAPNGRVVGSPFFTGKLAWFERLHTWLAETRDPDESLILGGDLNVTTDDNDVWDAEKAHGGTHVSDEEREALAHLREWGMVDAFRLHRKEPGRFSWWDYRAGMFQRNEGMRIDHIYVTERMVPRVVWAEIDREARKGKPTPSDHAPLVVDIDETGVPFDAGWEGAMARITARAKRKK
ncbi:MAG: exodeoxyribonuclease III [Acidimicrobiia bacterium]|nr:exodeoxyribonuclease III [Acidimicrobiia bacterium]